MKQPATDNPHSVTPDVPFAPRPSSQEILRIESIRAGYGKKEILRGITLEVSRGDLLALIGPNGAGKSTLLKVIAGFLEPSTGRVSFNGTDITGFSAHQRARVGIGYFMQGGRVFPSLTVLENLRTAGISLNEAELKKNVEQVLKLFPNLREMLGKRAGVLSGGERQALALSMVLVRRPVLMLLDEPSAGLSPKLVHEMLDKVTIVAKDWGTAIIMVEQNVLEALTVVGHAVALASGRLAMETKRPSEWLTNGKLEQLFLGSANKQFADSGESLLKKRSGT
ncbi:MAG: ABC transporter ATP-binding protein [Candidatus Eisenbacteria bacterium]|nr:ABC transporter ATP-binding protein [Candidatus Eisenbacteria bacterium]